MDINSSVTSEMADHSQRVFRYRVGRDEPTTWLVIKPDNECQATGGYR